MSSSKQSTTAKRPLPTLAEIFECVLTSTEYDDMTGPITISVTDALLQIAAAINRLASANERLAVAQEQVMTQVEQQSRQVISVLTDDGPGHA